MSSTGCTADVKSFGLENPNGSISFGSRSESQVFVVVSSTVVPPVSVMGPVTCDVLNHSATPCVMGSHRRAKCQEEEDESDKS